MTQTGPFFVPRLALACEGEAGSAVYTEALTAPAVMAGASRAEQAARFRIGNQWPK